MTSSLLTCSPISSSEMSTHGDGRIFRRLTQSYRPFGITANGPPAAASEDVVMQNHGGHRPFPTLRASEMAAPFLIAFAQPLLVWQTHAFAHLSAITWVTFWPTVFYAPWTQFSSIISKLRHWSWLCNRQCLSNTPRARDVCNKCGDAAWWFQLLRPRGARVCLSNYEMPPFCAVLFSTGKITSGFQLRNLFTSSQNWFHRTPYRVFMQLARFGQMLDHHLANRLRRKTLIKYLPTGMRSQWLANFFGLIYPNPSRVKDPRHTTRNPPTNEITAWSKTPFRAVLTRIILEGLGESNCQTASIRLSMSTHTATMLMRHKHDGRLSTAGIAALPGQRQCPRLLPSDAMAAGGAHVLTWTRMNADMDCSASREVFLVIFCRPLMSSTFATGAVPEPHAARL